MRRKIFTMFTLFRSFGLRHMLFAAVIATAVIQLCSSASASAASIPRDALQYGGHSYYIYSGVCDSWNEAERYCESLGGHLAVINNHQENQVLYRYMIQRGFESAYFGLTSDGHPGIWRWVNGDPVNYEHWHIGEPNNVGGREHWGMFYWKFEYDWNDGDFGGVTDRGGSAFICEWDMPVGSGNVQTSQKDGSTNNPSKPDIRFLDNGGVTIQEGAITFRGRLVNNSNRRFYFKYLDLTLTLYELNGTKIATYQLREPLNGNLAARTGVNRQFIFRNANIHRLYRKFKWHLHSSYRGRWN